MEEELLILRERSIDIKCLIKGLFQDSERINRFPFILVSSFHLLTLRLNPSLSNIFEI